jgi:hypothetical protein
LSLVFLQLPLHPIIISILFHHYKELKECTKEVEEIMNGKVSNSLIQEENPQETYEEMAEPMEEEEEEEEIIPTTLDGFIFS